MNILYLIGNGFDLAHKLPTSYNDFVCHYLKSRLNEALENRWTEPDGNLNIVSLKSPNPKVYEPMF